MPGRDTTEAIVVSRSARTPDHRRRHAWKRRMRTIGPRLMERTTRAADSRSPAPTRPPRHRP